MLCSYGISMNYEWRRRRSLLRMIGNRHCGLAGSWPQQCQTKSIGAMELQMCIGTYRSPSKRHLEPSWGEMGTGAGGRNSKELFYFQRTNYTSKCLGTALLWIVETIFLCKPNFLIPQNNTTTLCCDSTILTSLCKWLSRCLGTHATPQIRVIHKSSEISITINDQQ